LCKTSATFLIFFAHTYLGESVPPIERYQFGPTELLFSFQERERGRELFLFLDMTLKREIERASGKQKL